MGCCSEKISQVKDKFHQLALSEEETIITMREKSLPLSSVNLSDLLTILKKNETNGMLSIAQLRKAMTELSFDIEIFTTPETHIKNLLRILQNDKRLYDHKTVMLFGVVLGIGNPRDKAEILFDLYDVNEYGCLELDEVRLMVNEIFEVSVNKIPLIAVDDSEEPEKFTLGQQRMNEYIVEMVKEKEEYISKALSALFGSGRSIDRHEFVKRVAEDSFLESLVWSFQLRLALLN